MKKILSFVFAFLFSLSGCSAVNRAPYPVISNISFVAEIEYQNKIFEYAITISKTNEYKIDILKNGKETGLTIIFNNDKMQFSFQDLKYETTLSDLPQGLFIDLIYNCFNSIPKNTTTELDKDLFFIKNKTQKYDYKIYFSESGLPIKMEEKNNSITAIFKGMKIM